jgi:hypothetical protein
MRQHRGMLELQLATRLVDFWPTSFDDDEHTVEAILSRGSRVERFYGGELLQITS